jgi:predicted nucleic acid-binding protein
LTIRLFLRRSQWPIVAVADEVLAQVQPFMPLGRGEMAVLALGRSTQGSLILLDDALARREARRMNLHAQGTLGVLVEAYRRRHLTQSELALLLDELAARPDI